MATTTKTITLASLRTEVKRKVFILGISKDEALQQVVMEVTADRLGELIMEADGEIHPAVVITRFATLQVRSLETMLREMLKSILDMQLCIEVLHEEA